MIKLFSKWAQDIIQTPRPDVVEAKKEVEEAFEILNQKLDHLASIEGIRLRIAYNRYGRREESIFVDSKGTNFRLKYVSEIHSREV